MPVVTLFYKECNTGSYTQIGQFQIFDRQYPFALLKGRVSYASDDNQEHELEIQLSLDLLDRERTICFESRSDFESCVKKVSKCCLVNSKKMSN